MNTFELKSYTPTKHLSRFISYEALLQPAEISAVTTSPPGSLPACSAEGPAAGSQKAVPMLADGLTFTFLLIVPKGSTRSQNSFVTELNTQTSSVSKQPEEFSKYII